MSAGRIAFLVLVVLSAATAHAQVTPDGGAAHPPPPQERPPRRADVLRGAYGRYRANNDLRSYHLDVRVDPVARTIRGRNTIRFRMLGDDSRIQLDLYDNLQIDRVVMDGTPLRVEREDRAVFVDFPQTLVAGRDYVIEFDYSGQPRETGRFGGFTFGTDADGHPWITTSCEGQGSSLWWPGKDQWRDEPDDGMDLSVAVPSDLVDVSNGTFRGKTDLGDGYTRWDWHVSYPINSYDVALNIGKYEHFADRLDDLSLDFWVLPGSMEKARRQFAQARPMLEIFRRYFGEYPFSRDGYKLIEVPYAGMEHQSAIAYGNRFANGYNERDWTGVGISPRFDFIIIHESAHEWFGNAVTAADVSDMWIHEGWGTYLEAMYVEALYGHADAVTYINGYRAKVENRTPIITQRGIHRSPSQDQYFKGALFLHTLRSVVGDDERWWRLVRDVYQRFKYRTVMTEELVQFINGQLGADLTPLFDQYLRRAEIPVLELAYDEAERTMSYRWRAAERTFAMPIRAGARNAWQLLTPTADWQALPWDRPAAEFDVPVERYYIDIARTATPAADGAR